MSFFENTRKPTGLGGRLMVAMMNLGHRQLADWGFQFLPASRGANALDCGCGGGANVAKLLRLSPDGLVCGIDYSPVSAAKARKLNRRAVDAGRCRIAEASVTALPFADGEFGLVTAFETVYFWPGLAESFREIRRVMRPGGTLLLCNECDGDTGGGEKWTGIVGGMTVYKSAELRAELEEAGLQNVRIHKNPKKGWICLTAQKPAAGGEPDAL